MVNDDEGVSGFSTVVGILAAHPDTKTLAIANLIAFIVFRFAFQLLNCSVIGWERFVRGIILSNCKGRATDRIKKNGYNRGKNKGSSTSKYKGVSLTDDGKWVANINHQEKRMRLGLYATEDEAAKAYDTKAIELFGTYARLNNPPVQYEPVPLFDHSKGEDNGRSVLSAEQVVEIRRLNSEGMNYSALGRMFNVSDKTIAHIGQRITWKSIP
jgi:hypothetical protein